MTLKVLVPISFFFFFFLFFEKCKKNSHSLLGIYNPISEEGAGWVFGEEEMGFMANSEWEKTVGKDIFFQKRV